jgi:hypothetical protein
MSTLRQKNAPTIPCCGEADAFFADRTEVIDGKVYAVITDTRDDAPLHRPHIDVGTKIELPPDAYGAIPPGNPTEHTIIFVRQNYNGGFTVYCFVQSSGT